MFKFLAILTASAAILSGVAVQGAVLDKRRKLSSSHSFPCPRL